MSNEYTRKQIQESLDRAYERMINPDLRDAKREKIIRERADRAKKLLKTYGF